MIELPSESGHSTERPDDRAIIGIAGPLGISVHDHIIVGKNGHASLRGAVIVILQARRLSRRRGRRSPCREDWACHAFSPANVESGAIPTAIPFSSRTMHTIRASAMQTELVKYQRNWV